MKVVFAAAEAAVVTSLVFPMPGLAGDEEEAGSGLEVASNRGKLGPPAGDRRPGHRSGLGPDTCGHPESVELRDVAAHGFDQQLEHSPGWQPGAGEHRGDGGGAAPHLARERAQARPPGLVVQPVQRLDQDPLMTRRDVRPPQRSHPRCLPVDPTVSAPRRPYVQHPRPDSGLSMARVDTNHPHIAAPSWLDDIPHIRCHEIQPMSFTPAPRQHSSGMDVISAAGEVSSWRSS